METNCQIAAFEGGELRVLDSGEKSREAVLALPLTRLLVKMVRVPAEADATEVALPILKAMNPFPDDELTVSCEEVCEAGDGKIVIAAAMPESAADDIAEALDHRKLSVVKIDALVLGALRGVWSSLSGEGRRAVIFQTADCLSLIVLDGDLPSAIRAIGNAGELKRELMLSLLDAEDFGGQMELKEIVVIRQERAEELPAEATPEKAESAPEESGEAPSEEPKSVEIDFEVLNAFAPVRYLEQGRDAALVGIAERSQEDGGLNALPESWRQVLGETRFKAKLVKNLAIAGGVWLLIMGVLFGVPVGYDFMTDHQKSLCKQHEKQYKAVKEKKAKTEVVQKYSDHARGALEIMKAISDRLPEGVTLSSWDFKRDEYVRFRGDIDGAQSSDVLEFKDTIVALGTEEGGDAVFPVVNLGGMSTRKGKQLFELDCRLTAEEDGQ